LSGACPDGGGGGGPCAAWTQPVRQSGQSVATLALMFESDAATNAHLFGGRGHSLRVLSGEAFGGLRAEDIAAQIRSLSGDKAGVLALAAAFANFNNGGIAVSVGHGTDSGIEFAPRRRRAGSPLRDPLEGRATNAECNRLGQPDAGRRAPAGREHRGQ